MQHDDNIHIDDRELLLDADGELSASLSARIHAHLANCWTCRTRKAKLDESIATFVADHYTTLNQHIPPVEAPRALLRARIEEAAARAANQGAPLVQHRLAWATAALVVITASAFFALSPFRHRTAIGTAFAPNASLTPGATRPLSREAVCAAPDRVEARAIPAAVARGVFARYGIRDPQPRSYEVDYLIPPSLGGSDDLSNLWPQPYTDGVWSAHVKDALEDRLRSIVCEGQIDLVTAQRDLASDWIAAYKKYFQTDKPRLDHVAFVKDRPWE